MQDKISKIRYNYIMVQLPVFISFIITITIILISIIKFKLHPFFSLIAGSFLMGFLGRVPFKTIVEDISLGFGRTIGDVGIIVVFGITLGIMLHEAGCIDRIAEMMLRLTGKKKATIAVAITGYVVSIPVFFNASFVMLIKLIKSISQKGKIPFITLVAALSAGGMCAHSMIIPAASALAVAENMNVPAGIMLLYSIPAALFGTFTGGFLYAKWLGKRKSYEESFVPLEEKETIIEDSGANIITAPRLNIEMFSCRSNKSRGRKNSGHLGLFLIFLPIAIILSGTAAELFIPKDKLLYTILTVLGNKNVALLVTVSTALLFLRKRLKNSFIDIVSESGSQAGVVFIIMGASGSFGAVLKSTGIGEVLEQIVDTIPSSSSTSALMILIGFGISQILRISLGSTTISLVTTSALLSTGVASMHGVSPILVSLAICAGGIGFSLPNDSGFWLISKFTDFSMKEIFLSWTATVTIAGFSALAFILILNLMRNILPGLMY